MIAANTVLDERFQIMEMLAEGGIGRVWIAMDLHSQNTKDSKVIIKELKAEYAKNEYVLNKFFIEVEALKRINNEGVVKFLHTGKQENNNPYLAIEFIDGTTLRSQIKQGGISDLSRVANILKQLGTAIGAAHDCGIYHRDLKPENIMLKFDRGQPEEVVKVIDFGIATVKSHHDSETKTTMMTGTVDYMSPEQIQGKPSAATDIYAMGVIAYEMVTGTMPFNVRALRPPANVLKLYELQSKMPAGIVRPKALRPDLPVKADELIMEALAFKPQDRPARAEQFVEQLAEALVNDEDQVITLPLPGTKINYAGAGNLKTAQFNSPIAANVGTLQSIETAKTLLAQEAKAKSSLNHSKLLITAGIVILLILAGFGLNRLRTVADTPINRQLTKETAKSTLLPDQQNVEKKTLLLGYSFSLRESDGKGHHKPPIQIANQEVIFHNEDFIKFNFASAKNIFLYFINEGPQPMNGKPKYSLLFPLQGETNFLKQDQKLILPAGEANGLKFGGSAGEEKFWLIMSKEQVPQLQALASSVKEKDNYVITDENQIEAIKTILEKTGVTKPEKDDENRIVNIRANGDITVSLIKLQHN